MTGTIQPAAVRDQQPVACYGLSALQEGMLYHDQLEPGAGVDVEQYIFTIEAPVDSARLRRAWQLASERYDALRTSFRWDGDRPLQEVWPAATIPFAVEARSGLVPDERERYAASCLPHERSAIQLSRAPLMRVRLIRWSESASTLIWTMHHAILDGRARSILLRDIVAAYSGHALTPPAVQFGAQIAWLQGRDFSTSEPFWRAYLAGVAAPTPLPAASAAERGVPPGLPLVATRTLAPGETAALTALAHANGLTINVLVQAAWALLLSRCALTPDVIFGAVRACRHSGAAGSEAIVGLLVNTLPLRIHIDEDQPLVAWLQHVRTQWEALRDVEHTPLRAAAAWSDIAAPAPLFESLVVYERAPFRNTIRDSIDPGDALAIRHVQQVDRTGYPLTLSVTGTDELGFRLAAASERYAQADAERLLDQLTAILRAFPGLAAESVRDVALLEPAEARRIVADFNAASSYPRHATVPELFAEHAARTPDAIAAQLGAATMTYAELAAKADAVTIYLQSLGIGRGSYVGLCIERSFDMLAVLLGILQAGAASIALDPTHPPARIALMLADAAVTVIVAQAHLIGALTPAVTKLDRESVRIVSIETLPAPRAGALPAPVAVTADDAAHVMYTSGSTGTPKGAALPHRAVVRTVRGADYLNFDAGETFFAFVPLTFDVAILELWGPLLNGARLVLCPPGLPSLDVLAGVIEAQGVTTLWLTTALFEQMVEEQLPRLRGLRQLIVGGDVMSPAHARRALAALPHIRLLNVYGPTEAAVLITAHHLIEPPDGVIPLGKPIANAPVYVLDRCGRPVPVGVPGEIYTGGDGVALGYVNRPELTAERFVADPFADRPGATMYRTGDLARWRADGAIEFLGRLDTQVKIRGIRVELGEIESTLTDHSAVREAVVIAATVRLAEKQLIAYIVARDQARPAVHELQAFLHTRLPSQMVPPFVLFLDELPRTATGKFDRKALPDPGPLIERVERSERRAPASAVEIAVAAHVEELLGTRDIGLDDDFYAFGGDSLRAMRLISRLRDAFRVDLTIRDLLAAPTVGGIAAAIVALGSNPGLPKSSTVTALRTSGRKAPFFYLHGDLAGGGQYCTELARRLDPECPFYVIAPHDVSSTAKARSIEAMARENVAAIRALHPHGSVLLGGFCNGGIVAFEMARQLERAGVAVEHVVLLDAFNRNAGREPAAVFARSLLREALERTGLRPPAHQASSSAPIASADAAHQRLLARWYRVLGRYVARRYTGAVSLLWTGENAPQAERLTAQWLAVAPAASVAYVPGTHLTSITHHLAETSRILSERLHQPVAAMKSGTKGQDRRTVGTGRLRRSVIR